jgi:hypothetical protein
MVPALSPMLNIVCNSSRLNLSGGLFFSRQLFKTEGYTFPDHQDLVTDYSYSLDHRMASHYTGDLIPSKSGLPQNLSLMGITRKVNDDKIDFEVFPIGDFMYGSLISQDSICLFLSACKALRVMPFL